MIGHSNFTTGFNPVKMPVNIDEAYRLIHLFRQVQQVKLENQQRKKKHTEVIFFYYFLKSEKIVKLWIKTDIFISITNVWENICTDCQEYRIIGLTPTGSLIILYSWQQYIYVPIHLKENGYIYYITVFRDASCT